MRLLTTHYKLPTLRRSGQSLIEILIAVAVGVLLIAGAITLIVPSIRNNANVTHAQISAALGRELLENTRVFSESNWAAMLALATTSANRYYIATTSPFTTSTGAEAVLISTTTYERWFYLDDVYRNSSGKIADSGSPLTLDPSTLKITVVHTWPQNVSSTIVSYLARTGGNGFMQSDWSSGPGSDGPFSATSTRTGFSTSSNVDHTTSSGAIFISGMAGP